jgi:hypothetical protein
MLTKSEALELVSKELRQMSPLDDAFVVVDAGTIEKPYGWVFFYNSQKFIETGDNSCRLAGNGPVIVNKHDASVQFFGTANSIETSIGEYEAKLEEKQNGHRPRDGRPL